MLVAVYLRLGFHSCRQFKKFQSLSHCLGNENSSRMLEKTSSNAVLNYEIDFFFFQYDFLKMYTYKPQKRIFVKTAAPAASASGSDRVDGKNGSIGNGTSGKSGKLLLRGVNFVLVSRADQLLIV